MIEPETVEPDAPERDERFDRGSVLVPATRATVTDLEATAVRRRPPDVAGSAMHRFAKRTFDVVASVVLIVVLSPLALSIALAVILTSPGPALFRHERVGRRGRPFAILKFRTMVIDGDRVLEDVLERDHAARNEWERARKLRDDPRVTPVGRWLRRLSLDELPQLWNVLIGNMSLVGPRPVVQDELRYFGYRAATVLAVRPGLTGLWAVSGRSDVSYDERVELEYRYATEWTFLGDLAILLRTIPAMFHGHGAY